MFTGRRLDILANGSLKIYHYRARTYDPDTGRFLQTDPVGYADSMNLYEYVMGNPTNYVDPYGLFQRLSRDRPWWWIGWDIGNPFAYYSAENAAKRAEARRQKQIIDEDYRIARELIAGRVDHLEQCFQCLETGVEIQLAVVMGQAQGVANLVNGLHDSVVGLVNIAIWVGNNGLGTVPMAPAASPVQNQVQLQYVGSRDWSYGLLMDESRLAHEVSKIVGAESAEFLIGVGTAKVFLVVKKGKNAKQLAGCIDDVAEQAAKKLDDAADLGKARNPYGSKGKPDHQMKVGELRRKALDEAGPGERVLRERRLQGHPTSNRRPDVQIVGKDKRARKVLEADRHPTRKPNRLREAE